MTFESAVDAAKLMIWGIIFGCLIVTIFILVMPILTILADKYYLWVEKKFGGDGK